jgi:hypothetical protein
MTEPEKFQFGLPVIANPGIPEDVIGVLRSGRGGKSAVAKYLREGQPDWEMRPVGELKGGTQYYEIVWPWIEREFDA